MIGADAFSTQIHPLDIHRESFPMTVKIDDINTWPHDILKNLESPFIRQQFKRSTDIEALTKKNPAIMDIGLDLVKSCYQFGLTGYHCTKEKHPGFFKKSGLSLCDPKERIDSFLNEFGSRFSNNKLRDIKQTFIDWLNLKKRIGNRSKRVWFCLTKGGVKQHGTEYFFKYYGGEIIYWPMLIYWAKEKGVDPEVKKVLMEIGSPVVIETILEPSKMEFWGDSNLALSMLSYFGLLINRQFLPYDIDGYSIASISPEYIVDVHSKENFFGK